MPVKVGASFVSEAAYEFAKARRAEKEEGKEEKGKGVLKELKEKYPGLNITVGTGPFSGTGTHNLSISPKILKQMEQDPEKRMEYEALIYDVAHTDVNGGSMPGRKMKSYGFIIDDNGGLRAWGISERDEGNRRSQSHLKRSEKKNWWEEMLAMPPLTTSKLPCRYLYSSSLLAKPAAFSFPAFSTTLSRTGFACACRAAKRPLGSSASLAAFSLFFSSSSCLALAEDFFFLGLPSISSHQFFFSERLRCDWLRLLPSSLSEMLQLRKPPLSSMMKPWDFIFLPGMIPPLTSV